MMYEVLKRRYEKRENLPDLVMVDGGKGQLGVALAVLKDCGIEGVDVIGLAKERDELRARASGSSPADHPSAGGKPSDSGKGGNGLSTVVGCRRRRQGRRSGRT